MKQTIAWMEARDYKVVAASEAQNGTMMCYFGMEDVGGVYFQAHEVPETSTPARVKVVVASIMQPTAEYRCQPNGT